MCFQKCHYSHFGQNCQLRIGLWLAGREKKCRIKRPICWGFPRSSGHNRLLSKIRHSNLSDFGPELWCHLDWSLWCILSRHFGHWESNCPMHRHFRPIDLPVHGPLQSSPSYIQTLKGNICWREWIGREGNLEPLEFRILHGMFLQMTGQCARVGPFQLVCAIANNASEKSNQNVGFIDAPHFSACSNSPLYCRQNISTLESAYSCPRNGWRPPGFDASSNRPH